MLCKQKIIISLKLFLDKGVKLEGTNSNDQTVIMAAIISNNADIVREILKKDKSLLEEEIEDETILTWAIKNNRGFRYDYNAENYDGKNALMVAASKGEKILLKC